VITTFLATAVGVLSWGFNATYRNRTVAEYNTDYVSFLIIGILVASVVLSLGQGLSRRIRPWTMETILMTGLRTPTFILGTVLWTYLLSAILFVPQLLVGIYWFKAHLVVNFLSLVVSVLISSFIVFSLSMIATGFRLVTKVNDPITWGLNVAQQLLSGMTFPVSHLNDYVPGLSTVSWLLPYTWIYHITRLAALTGGSLTDPSVAWSFLAATIFAMALFPLALYLFRWSLRRAKRDGTLGWY
jgi:hypothetical protein